MEKHLVSIIIPVYNVEKYLEKCIESCFNQRNSNVEVIAIDDGSKDSSPEILDEMAKKHQNLKVIHKENAGVSSARNVGINNANGDYIVFVDADDYLAEDAIEYMMQIITETSSEFAVIKNCFTSVDQKQFENKISKISNEEAVFLLLDLSIPIGCWNKIYSKKLLVDNRILFNEDLFYGEGLQFILTVAQKSKGIGIGTKGVYYYRKDNLSSATTFFNYKKFENGEKSLLRIKNEFKINSKKIDAIWMYHYAIFAKNAMVSCINNEQEMDNYKEIYKEWREKFNRYFLKLIASPNLSLIMKIKLLIIKFLPQYVAKRQRKKSEELIKRSI